MAEGIDLYTKYQSVTDWSKVRAAGKTFCYVKVSDGMTAKPTNGWGPAGRSGGVAMGAYHYAQPGDPVAQADLLIAQAAASGCTDLGRALDLEAPFVPGQTAANFAIAFLSRIRDRGFLPVLYGSDSMLSYVAPQVRAAVPQTWIWVARYGANPKTPWSTWQYSSSGSVPGITASAVDLNTGAIPYNTATSGGFLMALTDQEQQQLYDWISGLYADASNTWVSTKNTTQGQAIAWMFKTLANTPDTSGDGKQGDLSLADYRQFLVDRLKGIDAKVSAAPAPQPASIDLDALAAKVAPQVAAAVGDAVAAAVATELAKRLES